MIKGVRRELAAVARYGDAPNYLQSVSVHLARRWANNGTIRVPFHPPKIFPSGEDPFGLDMFSCVAVRSRATTPKTVATRARKGAFACRVRERDKEHAQPVQPRSKSNCDIWLAPKARRMCTFSIFEKFCTPRCVSSLSCKSSCRGRASKARARMLHLSSASNFRTNYLF